MNIRETLLQEHSKKQTLKIVAYIGNDKVYFAQLIKLMLFDEYRVAQRAAWSVCLCIEKYPELLKPWMGKMIRNLQEKNIHDAVKRNTVRVFQDVDIPEKYCGELVDICYAYLHNAQEAIAVRAFSISVLHSISKKYPDLNNELKLSVESLLHCGISALESRSKRVLNNYNR